MILVGIDPSYARTGISVYYDGKIWISEVKGKDVIGKETFSKSFEGIYFESKKIVYAVQKEIMDIISNTKYNPDKFQIISECPPPQGQYAPGLYALDTMMFTMYWGFTNYVYRVYPNYLMHLHGKRNYQKSESVELAKKILEYYDVEVLSKRLSHDESESVIFLSRLLYKNGLLPLEIVDIVPNIVNEKENLFVYR